MTLKVGDVLTKMANFVFRRFPPVNSMSIPVAASIERKLYEQTGFLLGCQELKNGIQNVGLIIPSNAKAGDVWKAEDVFLSVAKEQGVKISRAEILHFVPRTERGASSGLKYVRPAM